MWSSQLLGIKELAEQKSPETESKPKKNKKR
jgi:hypothetical protein